MTSVIKTLVSITVISVVCACASPSLKEQVSAEFATEGLHKVSSSGFDEAYVHPNAKLTSYRAVNIEALNTGNTKVTNTVVSGTTRRDWQITPTREKNLAKAWAVAMDRAFASYQKRADGEQVLTIAAELTRVIPGRTSATSSAGRGKPVMGSAESVDIEVEFRLYDQASSDLLAVIRDRKTISIVLWSQSEGAQMGNLFSSWAGSLHLRISGK